MHDAHLSLSLSSRREFPSTLTFAPLSFSFTVSDKIQKASLDEARLEKLLLCETVRVEIKFPIRFHKYAVRIRDFRNLHSTASTHKGSREHKDRSPSLQSCHVCITLNSGGIAIRFRQPNHYRIRMVEHSVAILPRFAASRFPSYTGFRQASPSSHCENPRSKVE